MRRLVFEPPCASRSSFSSSSSSPSSSARRPPAPPSTPSSPATARRPPPAAGRCSPAGRTPRCRRTARRRAARWPRCSRATRRPPRRTPAGRSTRPGQHDHRRRHALPQGRRGRDGLRLRGARDHAGRGQLPGLRDLLGPDRLQAGDRAHVVRVALGARRRQPPPGLRPVRGDRARSSAAARRRPCGVSRADIALTDNAAPTISAGPTSAMFGSGGSVSGVQSIAVTFKDLGGGVAATGIQVDGQTVSETPVPNAGCRDALPAPRAVPADGRHDACSSTRPACPTARTRCASSPATRPGPTSATRRASPSPRAPAARSTAPTAPIRSSSASACAGP